MINLLSRLGHLTLAALAGSLVLVGVACGSAGGDVAPTPKPEVVIIVPTVPPPPTRIVIPTSPPPTVAPQPTPTPEPEPLTPEVPPEPGAAAATSLYPDAPPLDDTGQQWINSERFSLAEMQEQGKVVLIDFWTYTCINCIRTLPYLRAWHEKYADHGLVILGVHTPEFEFEKDYDNVVDAVAKFELEYPVVQDNEFGTWRSFGNQFWPAKYLIDHEGRVRYNHFGEGAYDETEREIRDALTEAGYDVSGIAASSDPGPPVDSAARSNTAPGEGQTRELYAGFERNYGALMSRQMPPYVRHIEYYQNPDTEVTYEDPGEHLNHFLYLQGPWVNTLESLVHARETIDYEDHVALKFFGTSVNVVMSPESTEPYQVRIILDDAPVPEERAGSDIMYDEEGNSFVAVDSSRMYYLVDQDEFSGGELRLASNSSEFTIFAFTFGSYEGGEPVKDM